MSDKYSPQDPESQERETIEANLDVMAVMIGAELNSEQMFRLVDRLRAIALYQKLASHEEELG